MAATVKDTSFKAENEALSATDLIKDLAFTAIITFLLLTPIVAYESIMNQGSVILETRWLYVLLFTAITVIGRLLLHLFVWRPTSFTSTPEQTTKLGQKLVVYGLAALAAVLLTLGVTSTNGSVPAGIFFGLLAVFFHFYFSSEGFRDAFANSFNVGLLIFAILLPFAFYILGNENMLNIFPRWDKRGIDFAITILIYVMLGWGLNIVVGLAGLLDLGYVAFYAVGAYTYALLTTYYLPQWFGDGIVPWQLSGVSCSVSLSCDCEATIWRL
jgi:branched-chain amino acid transport system permease protein